ncbi:hypothetical protein CV102_22700 [Natronococcus pandeyae]|uniref:NodB homology domain-containing protein n=1 Tax=Natronococcus pandeyae TaxID=2055836 RepID=A0A8J8Q3H3_9EURY|nr:polysaccharide deacetylase family protein [Natronococcus pandeyae]TYL36435.1 hypothetical protein CV102_22700 [Natronococcus pandeyae]
MVRVIVRADDIIGPGLVALADWFETYHPDVPCAAFAMETQRAWDRRSWQRARTMIEEYGWELGGHTRSHPKLSLLSEAEIRAAIERNVEDIERGLRSAGLEYSVASFAYPCGDFDERVVSILDELGLGCGLTYPDGFPYSSVDTIPDGADQLQWGVTHNGKFGTAVWNQRFDRVCERRDGLYVLCIHPGRWATSVLGTVTTYLDHELPVIVVAKSLARGLLQRRESKWDVLDEHLRYVKRADDVEFTTFRDCVEAPREA